MTRAVVAAMLLFTAAPAHAEPSKLHPKEVGRAFASPFDVMFARMREQQAANTKVATDEHTAADVANAPRPGQESGRLDGGDRDSTLRNIGQGVLFVPKVVIEATFAPVRGGLWAYEHYSIAGRFKRITFDDTNTYGVTPMLYVDNTYGATAGARFVHRNVFGAREQLAVRGAFGGEFNELVDGTFTTGNRISSETSVELRGEFERRPHDPFYGIGNNTDAIEVRHRQQIERGTATLDIQSADYFHTRIAGAITDLEYAEAKDGLPIDVVYGPAMLTGWTGTRNLYGELELRYDSRRVSPTLESKGVLLDAFAGRVRQLEAGNDYWRFGGEAIRFQPLGVGRTIATRLHLEAVNGSTTDVAFTQLPQLGGKSLLRGYPAERFRDRAALAGSAEYFWDLSSFMLASLFIDAGRVCPGIDEINFDDLRVGYGASLQFVDRRQFVAGVALATSIDGGFFVNLVLDPVYEPEPRVRQK